MGGERATCWGKCLPENAAQADEHVLVVPIIETVRAGRNIEELCRVDGVELFQFGPADYSSTAGFKGQWEGPGVAEQLLAIKDTIRRHGKQSGTRQMIEVLSLIKQHGHERVRAAVEEAISLGCSDAAAIRHLAGAADLAHARSAIVELGAALSRFERPLPALTDYDRLLGHEVAS